MNCKKKVPHIRIEKAVAVFMLLVGLAVSFMIPRWQTPDENTHLKQIGRSIGNEEFAEIIENSEGREYNKSDLMPHKVDISVVKHLPATLGIFCAILLGVPAYWILQFGELFSLVFYIFVCYYALKIMPIKKELFAVVMLIPMAIQQASSINYDSVLIPLCFYLIAYIFNLKFGDEIGLKQFLKIMALWLIITYLKMPYCLLLLLIFVLPLNKIHIKIGKFEINEGIIKQYRLPICLLGIVLGIVLVYCLRQNFWINMVLVMVKEWKRTILLLIQTGKSFAKMMIISSVGNFGWLDTPIYYGVAIGAYVFIGALAVANSDKKEQTRLTAWDRVIIWGTFIALCIFTTIALTNHTIMTILYGSEWVDATYDLETALYQIPYIGGIQGRYYLPFVSLLFFPLPQLKQVSKKKMWITISIFEIVLFVYIVYVLLNRYWIA